MHRGSRKHVLDWVSRPEFPLELLALADPAPCERSADSMWMPQGGRSTKEARLEHFGPNAIPKHPAWDAIRSWWLAHQRGANTPNWDIAFSCDIEHRPGLILVEAKANVPELSAAGKPVGSKPSEKSSANHERIRAAILDARTGLSAALPGISIDRDSHYQLANRLAFGWRLASLGIPTVLMYLGFTGDTGIRDVGEPFASDSHWQETFVAHLQAVSPREILSAPIDLGAAKLWVLSRSRPVIEVSPPKKWQTTKHSVSRDWTPSRKPPR